MPRASSRTRVVSALAALFMLAASPATGQQREPFPGLDASVNAALKTWQVPGVSIAIVRNDSLIYAKGYGVGELGKAAPVDERTLFAIGSASKAFTSAAIAELVDEKKIGWDDLAATYLPGFQLYDPYATRELTIRDLLSHRSGLARGDLLWYGTDLDRSEILRRVRYLRPSWSFRSRFGYQNLMYLAAGEVAAHVDRKSWDDVIRDRILLPLGMTSSNTSIRPLASLRNVATPHALIDDTVRVIPWRNIDNIGPAGSINSNALDMAQWVRLQLGKGKFAGKQLISERQVDEMHTPTTLIRRDGPWKLMAPASHVLAYGMGWFLNDYSGRLVVHHGGNIDGMSSLVAMLPEEHFGFVILTNMNGSELPYVVAQRLYDLQLGTPQPKDWNAEYKKVMDKQQAESRAALKKREAERVSGTRPSLPPSGYAGVYVDSLYGEVVVRETGGKLQLTRGPAFQGDLERWHYDTFRLTWAARNLGRTFVTFRLGPSGKAEELAMDMGGAVTNFLRRPEPLSAEAAAR
jgi:CubicO group peptidase (beta-lactamase class C family)